MAAANTSLEKNQLFSDITCREVPEIWKLHDLATLKSFVMTSGALSKTLVTIKSGHSEGTSSTLQKHIESFVTAFDKLKDVFGGLFCSM